MYLNIIDTVLLLASHHKCQHVTKLANGILHACIICVCVLVVDIVFNCYGHIMLRVAECFKLACLSYMIAVSE